MEKCFVIQPFDNDKFDRRYEDTFKHAIEKAGLEPYRIDKDPAVRVPIDDIEVGIANSAICFAEITSDNPNVWYELGYAFACGKEVVMVCSDERTSNGFPFDIRHRSILTYRTNSKSDFEELENAIINKITALVKSSKTADTLNSTPIADQQGLKAHEIAIVIMIAENQLTSDDHISAYQLREFMSKAGYTDIATSMGIKTLSRQGFVETGQDSDYNNNIYTICKLTNKGEDWLIANQDKLIYRKDSQQKDSTPVTSDDDLPF